MYRRLIDVVFGCVLAMVAVPLTAEWWVIGVGTSVLACLIRSRREPTVERFAPAAPLFAEPIDAD